MSKRRKNQFKEAALDAKREALASAAKQRKPELEEESDYERRIREWTSQGYTRTQAEHILEFSDREGIGQVG
jgi:hypothetical protein